VNDHQIAFNGTVMVTEQLGDEQLLAVRLGDSEIRIAGVDPDLVLSTGSQIEAAVATDNLHFFDDGAGSVRPADRSATSRAAALLPERS
jgi:hypothetical protein